MRRELATWTDRDLGQMPGLGNERPRGGAELKTELDPGLAVVRYLYDDSRVDEAWSTLRPRGYTWWADDLAQHVWSEPAAADDDVGVFRVFVETELIRGLADPAAAERAVDDFNGLSAGSALVVDAEAGTIRAVASMWVHEQSRTWVASALSVIGATQVAQAKQQATMLAPVVHGEMALSAHPESGVRPVADDMLGLLEIVRMDGGTPSRWAGPGMVQTLETMRSLPIVSLASGDIDGVSVEVPCRGATALIELDPKWCHPDLGHGMLVRLSMPGGRGPGPGWAAERNRQELVVKTHAHFVGSWIGSAPFAMHLAFYPNMVARSGLAPVNVALSTIGRARWVEGEGRHAGNH